MRGHRCAHRRPSHRRPRRSPGAAASNRGSVRYVRLYVDRRPRMRRHMNWHAGRSSFPVHAAFRVLSRYSRATQESRRASGSLGRQALLSPRILAGIRPGRAHGQLLLHAVRRVGDLPAEVRDHGGSRGGSASVSAHREQSCEARLRGHSRARIGDIQDGDIRAGARRISAENRAAAGCPVAGLPGNARNAREMEGGSPPRSPRCKDDGTHRRRPLHVPIE